MENFVYQNTTKIVFGRETEMTVGNYIKAYGGSKVLLHYGSSSIKTTGLYDRVVKVLKDTGIEFIELSGVVPNPRLSLVHQGISICRDNKVDFILAVGGGSVIDSAKAIAAGVYYNGNVWDLYTNSIQIEKALPIGVILTIPAAGSESSNSTVITNEDGLYKRYMGSEYLRPLFAILNPELTYTLPPYQTACGAADILAHIMERYFTNTKNVDLSDRLCEAAMKTIIRHVPAVLEKPDNYNSRAEIMWTGTIAHGDLLGMGRVEDWSSHNIEHEISGIYDVAHGAGLSVVFPAWMKYVYKHNQDKFIQFAIRVWNVDMDFNSPELVALEGIKRLSSFFRQIGLPVTLSELNISDDRLNEMADKCLHGRGDTIGSFVKLGRNDIYEILKLAR